MRWFMRLLLVLAVGSAMSGCWLQPEFDAGRTNANPYERALNPTSVSRLAVSWARDVQPGGRVTGIASAGNSAYVTADQGRVARLDARTGAPVWSRVVDPDVAPTPPPTSQPILFSGRLRVSWSCCRSGVAGSFWLDPADGAESSAPVGGHGGWAQPAIARGSVAGWADPPPFFRTLTWGDLSITATADQGRSGGVHYAIVGDSVYWSYGTQAVRFGAACRAGSPSPMPGVSCAPDWATDLGATPAAVASVGRGAVMWADHSGGVTVLDAATGTVRWRATVGAPGTASPVVAGGMVVVNTADGLAGLAAAGCGAATCSPVWRATAPGITGLAGGGGLAFATTSSGDVAAYRVDGCGAATCRPVAVVDLGTTPTRNPIVDGGRVLVGNDAGRVTALGLPPAVG